MHCKHCDYHFCWVCLKPNKDHYACEDSSTTTKPTAPAAFEDYNLKFYTNLFENMKMSLKLEQAFLCTRDKQRQDWVTIEFIRQAADVLFHNRRVLMYSYVFAYYIDANNHKAIFEENLENLRKATEELSFILEQDVNEATIHVMEQAVKDKIM
jgi:ariadne-1